MLALFVTAVLSRPVYLRLAETVDPEVGCLTPAQDQILKTSIMAIDATLKLTVTSLNIAAMWQNNTIIKEQLLNSSRIISAVDDDLVPQMVKITEETCGTCKQISEGVNDIVTDLVNTLGASVPEWKTNPIFNSVTQAVKAVIRIVPEFCPSTPTLKANVQCLTAAQEQQLKTSITAISATMTLASSSMSISAIWQQDPVKSQLEQASKILTAVNTQLISQMIPITETTCGTCSQISESVEKIAKALENTMSESVPDWKTNPIYMSVTTAVNGILGIVPNFCPSPTRFTTHFC